MTGPDPDPAALAAARQDPRRRVGPYVLLDELGRGGMGAVHRAWDEAAARLVAVKLLQAERDPEAARRFAREVEAMARVDHPGVVPVLAAGTDAGRSFLAMPLLEGGSLEGRLRGAPGALPLPRRVALVRDVARAVAAAHDRGVLHRDLKPANILLDAQGRAFVSDFGLVRFVDGRSLLTQEGAIVGTPAYLPPEQLGGAAVDARADVYALGGILSFALTGAPPFTGATPVNVLAAVLRTPATPPSQLAAEVPPALDAVVLRCLAKDPAARYPTAGAVADALDALLPDLEGRPAAVRSGDRRRAGPLVVAAAAGAVVLVGVGGVLASRAARPVRVDPPTATAAPSPATEAPPPATGAPPPASGAPPREAVPLELEGERFQPEVTCVAVSAQGVVASGDGRGGLRWGPPGRHSVEVSSPAETEPEPGRSRTPAVRAVAFTPRGDRLVSGGLRTPICVWDPTAATPAASRPLAATVAVTHATAWDVLATDARVYATVAGDAAARDGGAATQVDVLELATLGRLVLPFAAPRGESLDLRGGRLLITYATLGALGLISDVEDPLTPARRRRVEGAHLVRGRLLGEGGLAVVGRRVDAGPELLLWDPDTDALQEVSAEPGAPARGTEALVVAGPFVVAGGDDGALRAWRLAGRRLELVGVRPAAHRGPVLGLAASPDGALLASAGADGAVRTWRLRR